MSAGPGLDCEDMRTGSVWRFFSASEHPHKIKAIVSLLRQLDCQACRWLCNAKRIAE